MSRSKVVPVPVYDKPLLTLNEAAAYFNIGKDNIRRLTDEPDCEFVLFVGEKRLIKREIFEKYLESMYSV